MNVWSRLLPSVLLALVLGPVLLSTSRAGDRIPFRAWFNVTNLVFPHPTIPARLEVRVAGSGEASDLGKSTCETANQHVDLTTGRAVADYTLGAANGDQLFVQVEAQTVPDPASPQTRLTFSGGGKIISGTGRLAGVTGDLTNTGWSELLNPQTGEGVGYLEIRGELPKELATFVVTNTADSGPGSLRQAILEANATPEVETLAFNIPGTGPHSIALQSDLPEIVSPLHIDGTSQPGHATAPIIELHGGDAPDGIRHGLWITSGRSMVRGLAINRIIGRAGDLGGAHIKLESSGASVIEGCFVGLGLDGKESFSVLTTRWGIHVLNSSTNQIGGVLRAQQNVLAGNQENELVISGSASRGNVVEGNLIGTDASGASVVSGASRGIVIDSASGNVIGGPRDGAGNTVSAPLQAVLILSTIGTPTANRIIGNFIGTDITGTNLLLNKNSFGNTGAGIQVSFGRSNVISGNVIAGLGNAGETFGGALPGGVEYPTGAISLSSASRTVITGNWIGTDRSGLLDLGNRGPGILVEHSSNDNQIGGVLPGEGNVVAHGAMGGVEIVASTGNIPQRTRVLGNRITDNAGLGIDLMSRDQSEKRVLGVTTNDLRDVDSGPNGRQNFPRLTLAETTGRALTLKGMLHSRPDASFDLDFYASAVCDPSGHGEGDRYLGTIRVVTDAAGDAPFSATLATEVSASEVVTATATDANGNTSEFSACLAVVPGPPGLTVTRDATGEIVLSWETTEAGWALQDNASLGTPSGWKPSTGNVTTDGAHRSMRLAPSDGRRFFRLSKP